MKITRMKIIYVATALMLSVGMISCDSKEDNEIDRELSRLDAYLDSVKTITPVYSEDGWANIKTEYNRTIEKIEVGSKKLSSDANKKLEEVKAEYNKLKDDYSVHIRDTKAKEEASTSFKGNLRKALFGDEQIGSDMQFKFVTAKNALSVYDRFVNTVKDNRDNYSREDWDEIKLLYEALDTRKNEIEKDLPTADNLKIAKLKVQFAGIKAIRRPASKLNENDDAKKQ